MPKPITLAPVRGLAQGGTIAVAPPKPRKRGKGERGPRDPQAALLTARKAGAPRRQDLLSLELAHSRISQAEFHIGRRLETLFERARQGAVTSWRGTDQVDDGADLTEALVVDRLTSAKAVLRAMAAVEAEIGRFGTRVLRHVLDDRADFETLADLIGLGDGARGANVAGQIFRTMLRALSDAWAARGVEPA